MKKVLCAVLAAALLSLSAITVFAAEAAENKALEIIYGDVDGDGKVTALDAVMLQKYLAEFDMPESFEIKAADVNGDNNASVLDVICIQKYLVDAKSGTGRTGEKYTEQTVRRLLKSVKTYMVNYSTKEWELDNTANIEYENAYPTMIEINYSDPDFEPTREVFEYTFENGMPKTCTVKGGGNGETTKIEYNNGRVYDVRTEYKDGGYSNMWYQYANGDGYFTSLFKETYTASSGQFPEQFAEETDSIQVITENGLMKKSVNSGFYANWNERETKKWLRFNGTYTAEYDSDGIASVMSAVFRVGPSAIQNKIEVKKENGVITEAIVKHPNADGGFNESNKFEFEYNDTEISAARYSQMMNYFIVGQGSNYYNNNWY